MEAIFLVLSGYIVSVLGSPITNPLQSCPKVHPSFTKFTSRSGTWRLAYLFLGQMDNTLEEDNTCVVVDVIPTNKTEIELALFIDTAREGNVIDRSTAQFPATLNSPGDWQVHFPFASDGYLHARVIRASEEHVVITFCSRNPEKSADDTGLSSAEESLDWRSMFESKRKKRSFGIQRSADAEIHMWTAVLVKHNNISALKFVEYAAVLMKHGFDVTQGELVSFGTCPLSLTKSQKAVM